MSWDSERGALSSEAISNDAYWQLFNFVFSENCKKTSTYKFALLKSILDNLLNNIPTERGEEILYEDIFEKFAESFWNLVVKYHLRQQALNRLGKTSKVEQIFNAVIEKNPVLAAVEFAVIDEKTRQSLVRKVLSECKRYVLGALYGDFQGKLYGFDQAGDRILLSHGAYEFLLRYKMEIEKLNYYAWAKFLEKINDESVLYGVIGKLELSLPERHSLKPYRDILFREFESCNCFYCGKKLDSADCHVDHFIPWSFIKEDKLWNFVLSCPLCNLKKSSILPEARFIPQLKAQNERILRHRVVYPESRIVSEDFSNYGPDLIEDLWTFAQNAGFRVLK